MPGSAGNRARLAATAMPAMRRQPPQRAAGPVEGDHGGDPPEAGRWTAGRPASWAARRDGHRAAEPCFYYWRAALCWWLPSCDRAALTGQSPDKAVSTLHRRSERLRPPASQPGRVSATVRERIPAGGPGRLAGPDAGARAACRTGPGRPRVDRRPPRALPPRSVVRADGGGRQVPLSQLRTQVDAEVRRLQGARLVGAPRARRWPGKRHPLRLCVRGRRRPGPGQSGRGRPTAAIATS